MQSLQRYDMLFIMDTLYTKYVLPNDRMCPNSFSVLPPAVIQLQTAHILRLRRLAEECLVQLWC